MDHNDSEGEDPVPQAMADIMCIVAFASLAMALVLGAAAMPAATPTSQPAPQFTSTPQEKPEANGAGGALTPTHRLIVKLEPIETKDQTTAAASSTPHRTVFLVDGPREAFELMRQHASYVYAEPTTPRSP